MSKSSVKRRILQGIGANTLWQGTNVLIQLVGLPVFLSVWGVEKYGDWLVLSSLVAFLSMSSLGFAPVATNEMAMRVGRGDRNGALIVYQSIWALICVLSGLTLASTLAILWLSPVASWLPLSTTPTTTISSVLSVLAAHILVGQKLAIVRAGFRCDGNYSTERILNACGLLAEFIAQVVALIITRSMLAVAVASLFVRCISLVVCTIMLRRYSPWLRQGLVHAQCQTIYQLVSPAFSFLGMAMGQALSNQGMIQVAAFFLGPTAVVILATHRTLTYAAHQVINTVNTAVWPEYSTAFGNGDLILAKRIHRRTFRSTTRLSLCMCILLALGGPTIIYVWAGANLQIDYPLFALLLLLIFVRSVWNTSAIVPLASNQHQGLATTYVLCTVTSILLATIAIPHTGLIGVGIGLAFTDTVLTFVAVRMSLKLVNDELSDFVAAVIQQPFLFVLGAQRPKQ